MEKIIKRLISPDELNEDWDKLANCYFQKKEFLAHLHAFNPCSQRYYELYCNTILVAATVVYTLRINIFTFANIPSPLSLQVIGLPVSVASPPIIGDSSEFEYFLAELIKSEPGIILGINFLEDYLQGKVLNLRTLPTITLEQKSESIATYENSLRHAYRRRIHKIREKFTDVSSVTTSCSFFSEEHYALYLEIIRHTTTKLETLSLDSFKFLPSNFLLTTYTVSGKILCWNIVCMDENVLFFYFGGMDYSLRDLYQAYNNNLLGILETAIGLKYSMVDFGQTAEIAKTRLGGKLSERRMFLYHRNSLVLGLLKLSRKLISYSTITENSHVFSVKTD